MVLTEEQKKEILLKYIDPTKDFEKASNGKILLTAEASQRIAKAFNLKIFPDAQFEPVAIANYIFQREQQRLAAAASMEKLKEKREALERANLDRVVQCVKNLLSEGKNDFEIAQGLQLECADLALSDIRKGIVKATQEGVLPSNNIVEHNVMILVMRRALTTRFIGLKDATKDQAKLAAVLEYDLYKFYTDEKLSFGHLHVALLDAGILDETIDAAINGFYQRYEEHFLKEYSEAELSFEELANQIFYRYLECDSFNSRVLLNYIEKLNKDNINLEDFAYYLYVKEGDEDVVREIMMIPGISVEERVQKLKELDLEYPAECLKRTFDKLKVVVVLPYEEIFEKYVSTAEIQAEPEDDELIEVSEVISTLNEDGDSFEEEPPILNSEVSFEEELSNLDNEVDGDLIVESVDEEEYQPRRLKIVKKEKEVKALEKKKTLATLLIGAGFVPVAVLSWVFKVDPLVAAKNCVTALGQLLNGDIGLNDFLPSASQLTALLAGMGTTFVGFVKYLQSKNKIKKVSEELSSFEENTEFDDVEELEVSPSVKRGRR